MIEAGIGRLLVASLHQAIADLLPTRLEFYEGWLNTAGLRDGRIGLAPLAAVLSFLRQEGSPTALSRRVPANTPRNGRLPICLRSSAPSSGWRRRPFAPAW